ncbi:MAG: endolytic transglycosylase MltG [Hyphomonadaceae bacterium]|nr:endolytic transglycosylase MltG [Hyphomonadaceae bacterium]
MKALGTLFTLLVILGLAAAGAGYIWYQDSVTRPGPLAEDTVFDVSQGETLVSVANRAETAGIIRDDRVLRLHARLKGEETAIKVGEFALPAEISIEDFLTRLVAGDVVQYTITIPEGLTTAQIARRLEADDRLEGPLPDPLPAEGELLPETYAFTTGTTRADLLARMVAEQDKLIERLWPDRADDLPISTPEEAIILASVVQKEASGQTEYGPVASVFINRLNFPMRLQSDPTVIYGVSQGEPLYNSRGERRTLYRSELERDTPWNSYTRDGLPATAIANPGRGAIEGVLNPPETDFYYFVADGTGGHAFARTHDEHIRNVAAYRDYERREIARERSN